MSVTRKSHTGFRLVPTSMTLNDLERRNSHYFAFFSQNSTDFEADYIRLSWEFIIINVKINVALSENASRTRYTIKIKLKLRK